VISVQAIVLSLESLQIRRNHNWLKSLSFFFSPALRSYNEIGNTIEQLVNRMLFVECVEFSILGIGLDDSYDIGLVYFDSLHVVHRFGYFSADAQRKINPVLSVDLGTVLSRFVEIAYLITRIGMTGLHSFGEKDQKRISAV